MKEIKYCQERWIEKSPILGNPCHVVCGEEMPCTKHTPQSPSQEENDFTMTKRPQHEQDVMQKDTSKNNDNLNVSPNTPNGSLGMTQEEKCRACPSMPHENTSCRCECHRKIKATPSQSWESELIQLMFGTDITPKNETFIALEGFIKSLLSSREELLKQRCLESYEKAMKVRDSKMYGYYKSVFEDDYEGGYPIQWDEDVKEAVIRVFSDE